MGGRAKRARTGGGRHPDGCHPYGRHAAIRRGGRPRREVRQRGVESRKDAGSRVGEALSAYEGKDDTVVVGLPRGGVPVAAEVANRLSLHLDVVVVRKLGVPGHQELAMGAVASGGLRVVNADIVQRANVSEPQLNRITAAERERADRQEGEFRGTHGPHNFRDKHVILVDDGLATGASMRAALKMVQAQEPNETVVAVPVGSPDTIADFEGRADKVVSVMSPLEFNAVGAYYANFDQASNEEVKALLHGRRVPSDNPHGDHRPEGPRD